MNLYWVGLTLIGYDTRAISLYWRLGFRREGSVHSFGKREDRRWDAQTVSIPREGWLLVDQSQE
jgi:RimJ/RimL family protein N-acetyltransferase